MNPAVVKRWMSSTKPTAVACLPKISMPSSPTVVIPSFSRSFRPTMMWPSGRSREARSSSSRFNRSPMPESNSTPRTSVVSLPPVVGTR